MPAHHGGFHLAREDLFLLTRECALTFDVKQGHVDAEKAKQCMSLVFRSLGKPVGRPRRTLPDF